MRNVKTLVFAILAVLWLPGCDASQDAGTAAGNDGEANATVVVSISNAGAIEFAGKEVSLTDIGGLVEARLRDAGKSDEVQFLVRATPGANDILLARVAEALRKGGASNVEIERE